MARKTITDYESGQRSLHYRTRRAITEALQRAGVTFTWDDGEGTALVRRRTGMASMEAQPHAPTNLIVADGAEAD